MESWNGSKKLKRNLKSVTQGTDTWNEKARQGTVQRLTL